MKIIIIGGSLTGLINGLVLKSQGHIVHILEQHSSSSGARSDLAAGITSHAALEDFMSTYDRSGKPWAVPGQGIQFLNRDGGAKWSFANALKMTSWGVLFTRLKGEFESASSDKDGEALYRSGIRVVGVSHSESGVKVTYEDLAYDGKMDVEDADLVVLADGATSRIRAKMFPDVEREYAGYVAFRGTVDEVDVDDETKTAFGERLTYFSYAGGYILLYIIPGSTAHTAPLDSPNRRYNWVWYHPLSAPSPAFTALMTSHPSGTIHRTTLPRGAMNPTVWAQYVRLAKSKLCKPFATLVSQTEQPFVTAIGDVRSPRARGLGGRALITGEAASLLRPHLALSTSQSAVQAMGLGRAVGKAGEEEEDGSRSQLEQRLSLWETEVLRSGRANMMKTNAFGILFIYGYLAAAGYVLSLVGTLISTAWPLSLLTGVLKGGDESGNKKDKALGAEGKED